MNAKMRELEYEEENKKRIQLIQIQNQILALEEIPVAANLDMTPAEKVFQNELVRFKKNAFWF